jgi:hypothetical protein
MIQKGFEETAKKSDMDVRFEQVEKKFDKIETRLGKIETLLVADHGRRIEKLETDVKDIKDMLAFK